MTHTNSVGLASLSNQSERSDNKKQPTRASLRLEPVDCLASATIIEKTILKLDGVESAHVNQATSQLHISYHPSRVSMNDIEAALTKIAAPLASEETFSQRSPIQRRRARQLILSVLVAVICAAPLMLRQLNMPLTLPVAAVCLLATISQFYLGARLYRGALWAITTGHATIDLMAALGSTLAYGYSLYLWQLMDSESVYFHISTLIVALALIIKWTKHQAMYQAAQMLEPLLSLNVPVAHKWVGERLMTIAVNRLNPGDEIQVRPGERIAADGHIIAGVSSVDESLLTGQQGSRPKQNSDYVLAGSLNRNGELRIRVSKRSEDFQLNQIICYLSKARVHNPKARHKTEKASIIYLLLITIAAVSSGGYYWYVADAHTALTTTMAVILVGCPCALSIAAPYAFVVASNLGVQRGVLFKNIDQLQNLALAEKLVFSNTGTLTTGKHQVIKLEQWTKNDQWQAVAKKVMQQSAHPIAESALAYLDRVEPIKLDFKWANQGAMGTIASRNNIGFMIGNDELLISRQIALKPIHLRNCEPHHGRLWIVANGNIIARFDLKDSIRDMAHETIDTLRQQGFEFSLLQRGLSGATRAIGGSVGIRHIEKDLTNRASHSQKKIALVGNGLKDCENLFSSVPASIVLGNEDNAAIGRGGINLMRQDISLVYEAIQIARKAYRVIYRNRLISTTYNSIAVPLAMAGLINPILAAFLATAISLTLLTHTRRLQNWQPVPVRPIEGNPMDAP